MNHWISESIKLANSSEYLDKIHDVYEMQINPERPLTAMTIEEVRKAFDTKDDAELIRLLIENAEVFPVKDSYIGFLRLKPEAAAQNPKTIKRIASRLYTLGIDGVLREASRPKETNRQLGHSFRKWSTSKLGIKVLQEEEFISRKDSTVMLSGGDKSLYDFAVNRLGCKLRKGIDLVIKKNNKYLIGEAKFLTTPGGEQNGGFTDAEGFVQEKSGKAARVAIIDGYIWLKSLKGIHERIVRSDADIMSALLLNEFLQIF